MTYQEWDFIADSYIPALGLVFIIFAFKKVSIYGWHSQAYEVLGVLISVMLIYGIMFIDNVFNIWPRLGLDYSTHTALSLVFVTHFSLQSKNQRLIASLSMILYIILMIYQKYHTLLDIFTTSIIVLPFITLLQFKANEISTKLNKSKR
ncbi:hypothetical protein [Shewanella surugensis]|uniref:Phosphatase PAP2 family protein n=1 Tax=Shewanella surugensis TaxID=212020 RepID=A0ABT0L5G2_9GAMM|nr:hypothetical protein [Shewanella surugensis]MCL1122918.1 hypothetical protein [Shewanella surugensis]